MGKLNILIFICIFFSANVWADINHPHGAIFLNKKAYSISLEQYAFMTSGYYDIQGHQNNLSTGSNYKLFDTTGRISYAVESNFAFDFFGKFRLVNSNLLTGSENKSGSNSGIESGGIGLKYQLRPFGNFVYAIAGEYRKTLYTNTKYDPSQTLNANKIILGDDGSEYKFGVLVTSIFSKQRWDANLFYVRPPNELSAEINYGIEYSYFFNSFGLLAGVSGIISLKNDPYTNEPTLKPKMDTGATSLFNSINHEVTNIYFGSDINLKKNSILGFRLGTVINGVSVDKGYFASINLSWNTSGNTKENEKIESFKEYNIDGSVLKVSARGAFVKIDQGLSADVEKGMKFDIYQTDYFGGNVLVASGFVTEIGADWSIIKVVKKYTDIEIRPGFSARAK